MKIYNYDEVTKEITSESNATPDPLDKGKFLIPRNATPINKLPDKKGFTQWFNESIDEWVYIEDHRGETIHDTDTKNAKQCNYIGPIKENHALGEYQPTDQEIQEAEREAINHTRRQRYYDELPPRDVQENAMWDALEALAVAVKTATGTNPIPTVALNIMKTRRKIRQDLPYDEGN